MSAQRKRKWYGIPNRDASQAPDHKRVGEPLTKCLDQPPMVKTTYTDDLKARGALTGGTPSPVD